MAIKNKRGQIVFYTLMLCVVVIVVALALSQPLKQQADITRNVTTETGVGLDCSNSSISTYQRGQCILTDLSTPYFIGGLLAIAGIIAGARILYGE